MGKYLKHISDVGVLIQRKVAMLLPQVRGNGRAYENYDIRERKRVLQAFYRIVNDQVDGLQ